MRWWDKKAKYGLYETRFEHDNCGVGFVCNIKGKPSHSIVKQALEVLKRLAHRGAVGADPDTGDGAGILLQMPHEFFKKTAAKSKINLPKKGSYASGLIFLPKDIEERLHCKDVFYKVIKKQKQVLLGFRAVKVDSSAIGRTARKNQPIIGQIFIGKGEDTASQLEFERKLYLIRKQVENLIRNSSLKQKHFFHVVSLSSRTFVYKGLFTPQQLENFFPELKDESLESAIALVHSRYSTNTFPEWSLAQPFRFLAHNGEINTLRGNVNWMKAREGQLDSAVFGDIKKLKPVLTPDLSDSATIDNAFEFLVLGGKPLYQAMMTLIPAAWENNPLLDKKTRDFYKYQACTCEPWDGPAAIAFTDGSSVGAVLDRNGLRPARYIITKDGRVIMASEMGVLDVEPADIAASGRIEPGKMFYIDTNSGRLIDDSEIKEKAAQSKPYSQWLKDNMLDLDKLPLAKAAAEDSQDIFTLLKAFGYSREDLKTIIGPMAEHGIEPTGSMGNDTPLAVLSKKPQLLYSYFKQLFAQVTNPAIDPIREECVMSLESFLGPQANILDETALHCRKLKVKNPILTDEELLKIKGIKTKGLEAKTVSVLFDTQKEDDFITSLERLCREAVLAINEGYSFIVLSDRGVDEKHSALPALLSVGMLHQYLVKRSLRTRVSIIIESAEPREVHHFALLFGYGADAIDPYLAYRAVEHMVKEKLVELDKNEALENYRKASVKGILKILSKMGISTLQSYKGAQIFEALGIAQEVINRCFAGTVSRIEGAGFGVIEQEVLTRHSKAFLQNSQGLLLDTGGLYQWKKDGEFHLWQPQSIAALQDAARTGDYQKYKEFARLIDEQSANPTTLRGLLKFKKVKPVPIEEVEPVKDIFKRFATGAMSFGSISKGAHETLALAMNRLGGRSNTGEGGEDPERFKPLANGDSKRSAIKQVASGRFGVATNYLVNADEIQIKIAQGAKPGEGGQLPGHKVSVDIAKIRYTTPGVTLISPPPHHDIYSIEDLAQLIFDLKNVNPKARISVKLVSESGVGTVAAGVAKGHADMILISGGDGGTGASPISSIRHAGLPWELGLAETHQTLVLNNLRSRVRLQTDGQMRTAKDVAVAAMLGAEEFGFCTAPLIVLGCVMLRHCHLNNCSVGVATQDKELSERFKGKVEHIENYFHFIAKELREIMAQLGVRKIEELIGRTDLLELDNDILPWKAKKIDYSRILFKPQVSKEVGVYCSVKQEHGIDKVLDKKLIKLAQPALSAKQAVKHDLEINNTNRTTGAMLSGKICSLFGEQGLKSNTLYFKFKGIAGQSFGAWLAAGVTFELEGLANDYVGKGISGGKIIIYPFKACEYKSEENIIMGNTSFYGAIKGEAYIRGVAGERFCIRNSGLHAVVEGVGDHGCEYMTGGRVVILGKAGRNFAAGMSGGIAYVYDQDNTFKKRCNMDMVEFDEFKHKDKELVLRLILRHYHYTHSPLAKKIIDDFENLSKKFVKVMPKEYKKVLEHQPAAEDVDLEEVSDG